VRSWNTKPSPPEGLKVYLAEYQNEMRRLARDISKRQGSLERKRAKVAAAIDRIVDRLADGTIAPPIAKAKLDDLIATAIRSRPIWRSQNPNTRKYLYIPKRWLDFRRRSSL
jgi:hypothetical protein